MNIHRIFYPVLTLGPGRRLGIWTRGCRRQCPGCSSPELWQRDERREIPLPALLGALQRILADRPVDGVTISGGEPMEQRAELLVLLAALSDAGVEDILLYTGLTREELGADADLLRRCATVICGPYNMKENDGRALRGSANQEILFRNARMEERYREILTGPRTVQPVLGGHELFLIGILNQPEQA